MVVIVHSSQDYMSNRHQAHRGACLEPQKENRGHVNKASHSTVTFITKVPRGSKVHTVVETLNDKRSNLRGSLLRPSLIKAQKGIKVCQDRDRLWWRHTYTETHEVNGPRSSLQELSVRRLQFLPLLPMVTSDSTTSNSF